MKLRAMTRSFIFGQNVISYDYRFPYPGNISLDFVCRLQSQYMICNLFRLCHCPPTDFTARFKDSGGETENSSIPNPMSSGIRRDLAAASPHMPTGMPAPTSCDDSPEGHAAQPGRKLCKKICHTTVTSVSRHNVLGQIIGADTKKSLYLARTSAIIKAAGVSIIVPISGMGSLVSRQISSANLRTV